FSLARKRVDLALQAGGILAVWDLDIGSNDMTMEGRFPGLLDGDDNGLGVHRDDVRNLIHPDDRERVLDALGTAIATGSDYHCPYRAITPSGEVRRVAALGRPVRDGNNPVYRLTGILIDLTEQA